MVSSSEVPFGNFIPYFLCTSALPFNYQESRWIIRINIFFYILFPEIMWIERNIATRSTHLRTPILIMAMARYPKTSFSYQIICSYVSTISWFINLCVNDLFSFLSFFIMCLLMIKYS